MANRERHQSGSERGVMAKGPKMMSQSYNWEGICAHFVMFKNFVKFHANILSSGEEKQSVLKQHKI